MSARTATQRKLRPNFDQAERDTRVQLAACYRLVARFGWTDLIYTHISARVPGLEPAFLLNPYGMLFEEITASNLVKMDFEGNVLDDGGRGYNKAGFVIHSAVLAARPDVNCVLHTHSRNGVALSMLNCGLLPISQFALFYCHRMAYHDYEGVALDMDERVRLASDLGDRWVMILRNHGLLTAGRTVGEALLQMDQLERACAVQLDAMRTGAELVYPSREAREAVARLADEEMKEPLGAVEWNALTRMLDREDPSYRD